MGGRKHKDQGKRGGGGGHKQASTGGAPHHAGKKSSLTDDPFYDLPVVDEQLVWITWEESFAVATLLFLGGLAFLIFRYQHVERAVSLLFGHTDRQRRAVYPETSKRMTMPDQKIVNSGHRGDDSDLDFLQLVEEPMESSAKTSSAFSQRPASSSSSSSSSSSWPKDTTPCVDPPRLSFEDYTRMRPHLCRDGKTYGYDTYAELEKLLHEINEYSHERYIQWDSFYETAGESFVGVFDDPSLYYEEEIFVTICPQTVLRRRRGSRALYLNAETVLVECEGCRMEIKSGSHMIFGPYAQDVMVRGIHFVGATETSIRFPFDGAEVYFEDCFFSENKSTSKHIGTVADVNSTSSVDFMRCLMEKEVDSVTTSSSLSIRTKDEVDT
jgi:hypothetical protein